MAEAAQESAVSEFNAPLLLSRYQPVKLLARGGESSVYRGRDELLGRDVAIKVFAAGDEIARARFREEISVLAGLNHHGIVSIVDAGIDDSSLEDPRPFLVMQFVQGRSMRDTLSRDALNPRQIGEAGFEVAEALDYVHTQGVTHRDITPSNIMLVDYGTSISRIRAKLTDFGIAIKSGSLVRGNNQIIGTPAYLSPEQVEQGRIDGASDIYSLGLVMLECFTGVRAFDGEPLECALLRLTKDPKIPDSVPAEWKSLLQRMTERRAEYRPSAADTAEAIRRILRTIRP